MVTTLADSPMPSHRINSGSSAILGTGNSAEMKGRPAERPSQDSPIRPPRITPAIAPISQPRPIRASDAPRWRKRSPLAISSRSATAMRAGLGRKSESITPAELPACQSASTPAKKIHATRGRGFGSKPPPRKPIRVSFADPSRMRAVSVSQLRLLADEAPQFRMKPDEVALRRRAAALAARDRHRHDLPDAAGPPAQDHDPVGHAQSLMQIVRHIGRGGLLARPDRLEVLHQQVARLGVERRERLVPPPHRPPPPNHPANAARP